MSDTLPAAYRWPLVASLALHGVVLALVIGTGKWVLRDSPTPAAAPGGPVVQAVAVDRQQVEQELARLRQAEQRRSQASSDLEKKLAREKARLAALRKERQAQQKRAAAAAAETRRLAAQKQQAEAARRKAQAAAQAAARQAQEAARQAAEAQEAARQAQAERERAEAAARAEKERIAAAERKRAEAEHRARLQRQLQEQLAAEQSQLDQSEVERYKVLLRQRVENNWVKPPNWPEGQACEVRVQLIPGGEVASANVIKSCGDAALDRSVESAVIKASPLPVPSDPRLFNAQFRNFVFVFKESS